jgi:hypothetical protein
MRPLFPSAPIASQSAIIENEWMFLGTQVPHYAAAVKNGEADQRPLLGQGSVRSIGMG